MIATGLFVALLCACQATAQGSSDEEIPFVIASPDSINPGNEPNAPPFVIQQAPSQSGGFDTEALKRPARGYVYPKPSNPLNLPPFVTLDSKLPLDGSSAFSDDGNIELERTRRSPQRRPYYQSYGRGPRGPRRPRPQVLPNYPGIRPLPALYGGGGLGPYY